MHNIYALMKNHLVAHILNRVADYMELRGDEFRTKAYRRAARTVEFLGEDIEDVAAQGRLRELPGIGENIAAKIEEILSLVPLTLKLAGQYQWTLSSSRWRLWVQGS